MTGSRPAHRDYSILGSRREGLDTHPDPQYKPHSETCPLQEPRCEHGELLLVQRPVPPWSL